MPLKMNETSVMAKWRFHVGDNINQEKVATQEFLFLPFLFLLSMAASAELLAGSKVLMQQPKDTLVNSLSYTKS